MEIAIIFAVLAYLGWGAGDIPATIATRKIGAIPTSFWVYLVGLLGSSLYIPFALSDLNNLSPQIFLVNMLLAFLLAACYLGFNQAFRIGNVSIVGTIAGSFSAVTIILSLIFLKETLSFHQIFSIMIIFLGIILTSLDIKDLRAGKFLENKGTWFALAVMIGWGIYYTFIKIPIKEIGWFWPNYISVLIGTIALGAIGIKNVKSFNVRDRNSIKNIFIAGILLTAGTFSFNFALSSGTTSVVAPIVGSYTTLFVLLSRYFFKDVLTKQQWLGIIVTLVGIILLAFISN